MKFSGHGGEGRETVDLRGVRHDGYIIEIHSIRISEIIKILLKNNCMNVTEH